MTESRLPAMYGPREFVVDGGLRRKTRFTKMRAAPRRDNDRWPDLTHMQRRRDAED